jgi:hypothetical protein
MGIDVISKGIDAFDGKKALYLMVTGIQSSVSVTVSIQWYFAPMPDQSSQNFSKVTWFAFVPG